MPGVKKSGLEFTIIAPGGGVVRTYDGTVDEGALEEDDETLELVMDDNEVDEGALEEDDELMEEDEVEDIELELLELLEMLEDVDETDVVEVAVLMQEQPLETLEGNPEHAAFTQAGRLTGTVAAV
jgi:hypothetical protein